MGFYVVTMPIYNIIIGIQTQNLSYLRMQLQQNLLNNQAPTPNPQSSYFIDRYNVVISTYNKSLQGSPSFTDVNTTNHTDNTTANSILSVQGDNRKLQYLDNSQLFKKICRILSNNCVKILLVILLAFAPFVNLLIYGALWFYYLFLRRETKKHKNNLKKTKNPFHSYYFLPEICNQLNKHCTTIEITPKQLQGFTFNNRLFEQIKQNQSQLSSSSSSSSSSTISRTSIISSTSSSHEYQHQNIANQNNYNNQNAKMKVTIYDQYFYDSFHLFKKEQYKVAAWILLATVLIAADVILYGAVFDLV